VPSSHVFLLFSYSEHKYLNKIQHQSGENKMFIRLFTRLKYCIEHFVRTKINFLIVISVWVDSFGSRYVCLLSRYFFFFQFSIMSSRRIYVTKRFRFFESRRGRVLSVWRVQNETARRKSRNEYGVRSENEILSFSRARGYVSPRNLSVPVTCIIIIIYNHTCGYRKYEYPKALTGGHRCAAIHKKNITKP